MHITRAFLVAAFSIATTCANAIEETHLQAAKVFFEASRPSDTTAFVRSFATEMVKQNNGKESDISEWETLVSEVMNSPEFRQAKIRSYAQIFTESELQTLTEFVRQPAYAIYTRRSFDLQVAQTKAMVEAFTSKLPDIERRFGHLFGKAPAPR